MENTMDIRLDKITKDRINILAQKIDKTPEWIIKEAIFNYLSQQEHTNILLPKTLLSLNDISINNDNRKIENLPLPFCKFSKQLLPQSQTRAIITSYSRCSETQIIPILLEMARPSDSIKEKTHQLAYSLCKRLRDRKNLVMNTNVIKTLLQEFSLSSQEGISLMCLSEALLRIPDTKTKDLLIYDKIMDGYWTTHLRDGQSKFIKITIKILEFTKYLLSNTDENHPLKSIKYTLCNKSKPIIRNGIKQSIQLIGKQFVGGEKIKQALVNSRIFEKKGFRYSYDMLGEAALTMNDAKFYLASYQEAIHCIGEVSNGKGIYEGPGISIKLSALHPRYTRTQYRRVIEELYPILKSLTLLARSYNIGITIDAEESDKLDISLDMLETLCCEPELKGWHGIGFAVQAYQKRSIFVIDLLIELARKNERRLMIRLVKGAYWDSEIKRCQLEGLEDYPVYTRKVYTDISYLACARKLLSEPNLIYPQFATHNAYTLAMIYQLGGVNYYPGQYEFQCLYGMGELLYEQVVGKISENKLNRVCRIYTPVGSYKTLLSYLVRRILENGANSSFVNHITNNSLLIDEIIKNPIELVDKFAVKEGVIGLPNPKIPLPRYLYGHQRVNSSGVDLANEHDLSLLSSTLLESSDKLWISQPIIKTKLLEDIITVPIINPAKHSDLVGNVRYATEEEVSEAIRIAHEDHHIWLNKSPNERANILEYAAQIMENQMNKLIGLLVRESGKTYKNAISEVREAVDFLYYYSNIVRNNFDNKTHIPLGLIVCISPWNFPLAIFTGQIGAALAAGNSVLAKPAEQTPLIAAQVIRIMLEAGVPCGVLQFLPGLGESVGTQLICDQRVQGVIFTGSLPVAKFIQRQLAQRLNNKQYPVTLIAETGGINAMIVDSSALTEQVVLDIITSCFDSAGQRCSALRLLCIQEDIAEHTIKMLREIMMEYRVGDPEMLSTDIGPIIDNEAKINIEHHIQIMRNKGFSIFQGTLENSQDTQARSHGTFVIPTIIELNRVSDLSTEIFGPVLHIVRYSSNKLIDLIDEINSSGYGLTFGLHSRINKTVLQATEKIKSGNIYINRNMIGAVVGSQPFGGEGLSGTGPKAGGPLYLYRLLANYPDESYHHTLYDQSLEYTVNSKLRTKLLIKHQILKQWASDKPLLLDLCKHYEDISQTGAICLLRGPTGERNTLNLLPREKVLCIADNEKDILTQLAAITSIGSRVIWQDDPRHRTILASLPCNIQQCIKLSKNIMKEKFDIVVYHGSSEKLLSLCKNISEKDEGEIISVLNFKCGEINLPLERLLIERSISVNTAAAGGNVNLIMIE